MSSAMALSRMVARSRQVPSASTEEFLLQGGPAKPLRFINRRPTQTVRERSCHLLNEFTLQLAPPRVFVPVSIREDELIAQIRLSRYHRVPLIGWFELVDLPTGRVKGNTEPPIGVGATTSSTCGMSRATKASSSTTIAVWRNRLANSRQCSVNESVVIAASHRSPWLARSRT